MLYIKPAMHSVHASSSQLLKSFEVDSSHMPLSSQVKSNVIKSTVVDLGSFYPKSGHVAYVSVPPRLAGLMGEGGVMGPCYIILRGRVCKTVI